MNSKNANVIIPSTDEPEQPQMVVIVNSGLMFFGLACFGVAFLAATVMIYQYMIVKDYPHPEGALFTQVISLALLFLMGWSVSLVSVRVLRNRLYPFILRALGIFVSFGMVAIYGMGIVKCFQEKDLTIVKYVAVLLAGYLVLVAF